MAEPLASTAAGIKDSINEDLLELYGFMALHSDGTERLAYEKEFRRLYNQSGFPEKEQGYGRVFNYRSLMEIIVPMTKGSIAEEEAGQDETTGENSTRKPGPFRGWTAVRWKRMGDAISQVYSSMIRQDASALIGDAANTSANKDMITNKKFFLDNSRFNEVLRYVGVHGGMAPYRLDLEETIAQSEEEDDEDDKESLPLNIPDSVLDKFKERVEREDDTAIKKTFQKLLRHEKFLPSKPMKELLHDPDSPFCFDKMYGKINKALRVWTRFAIGRPKLYDVYVDPGHSTLDHADDEKRGKRAREKLERSRQKLTDSVDDPLGAIVSIAMTAQRRQSMEGSSTKRKKDDEEEEDDDDDESEGKENALSPRTKKARRKHTSPQRKRRHLLEKKRSAERLQFDEDDDDDVLSDPGPRPSSPGRSPESTLGSPTTGKQRKSQKKKYNGRKPWTDLEKDAIKEGLLRFGPSRWADMKKANDEVFSIRTSTQIKDCFRTMKAKGELDDLLKKLDEEGPEEQEASTEEAS